MGHSALLLILLYILPTSAFQQQQVEEGDDLTLPCNIPPDTTVHMRKWSRRSPHHQDEVLFTALTTLVRKEARKNIDVDPDTFTLHITDVTLHEEGNYTCTVFTNVAELQTSVDIRVNVPLKLTFRRENVYGEINGTNIICTVPRAWPPLVRLRLEWRAEDKEDEDIVKSWGVDAPTNDLKVNSDSTYRHMVDKFFITPENRSVIIHVSCTAVPQDGFNITQHLTIYPPGEEGPRSSGPSAGAVAGATVGTIVILLLLAAGGVAGFLFYRKRKRSKRPAPQLPPPEEHQYCTLQKSRTELGSLSHWRNFSADGMKKLEAAGITCQEDLGRVTVADISHLGLSFGDRVCLLELLNQAKARSRSKHSLSSCPTSPPPSPKHSTGPRPPTPDHYNDTVAEPTYEDVANNIYEQPYEEEKPYEGEQPYEEGNFYDL